MDVDLSKESVPNIKSNHIRAKTKMKRDKIGYFWKFVIKNLRFRSLLTKKYGSHQINPKMPKKSGSRESDLAHL